MHYDIRLGTGGRSAPCIYLIDSPSERETAAGAERDAEATDRAATVVRIPNSNWDDDLTPWPARKVFKRAQGDFGGNADAFLRKLVDEAIPAIEQEHGVQPAARALAGYSLAGLFAVYALTKTDRFVAVASISGSLWYDDLLPYLENTRVRPAGPYVYLSLGDKEHITKNKRMRVVQERTFAVADVLHAKGAVVDFEQTAGTHFQNVAGKTNRALDALEAHLLAR